jgi:hypothetical protein
LLLIFYSWQQTEKNEKCNRKKKINFKDIVQYNTNSQSY